MDSAKTKCSRAAAFVGGLMGSLHHTVSRTWQGVCRDAGRRDSVLRAIENRLRDRLGDDALDADAADVLVLFYKWERHRCSSHPASGSRGSGGGRATASIDGAGHVSIRTWTWTGSVAGPPGGRQELRIIDVSVLGGKPLGSVFCSGILWPRGRHRASPSSVFC